MTARVECPKIIIVEDDRDIRETLALCLETEGYGVESYANGRDAIDRLRHKPEPCLILLDMMMPIMDGAAFMREFAKLPATIVPVPVYLCSASACAEDQKRLACHGFIKKPVDLQALLIIVGKFCETSSKAA
jgi:CheY-like chemotaxis protein